MTRKCGECSVCCYIGAVPEIEKPPHTQCPFVKNDKCGSCSIFDSQKLPKVCKTFECLWKEGEGTDSDRPNELGVMFSSNMLENQFYDVAIELWKYAMVSKPARKMAAQIATTHKNPIIVVKHDAKPPNDTGDFVILHKDILKRAHRIIGDKISDLNDEVAMYHLVKEEQWLHLQ